MSETNLNHDKDFMDAFNNFDEKRFFDNFIQQQRDAIKQRSLSQDKPKGGGYTVSLKMPCEDLTMMVSVLLKNFPEGLSALSIKDKLQKIDCKFTNEDLFYVLHQLKKSDGSSNEV